MKQIPVAELDRKLSKRNSKVYTIFYALVDDEDYELLNRFTWYISRIKKSTYAATWLEHRTILMHNFILVLGKGLDSDHINGNGLDNRRINLRPATRSQNTINGGNNRNTSGYKGVHWSSSMKKWQARLMCKGIRMNLGFFESKEKAALIYNEAAIEYFGEYAKLNEVKK